MTPLSRLSAPIALPRSYARRLSQVAPTLIPAGKTETRLQYVSKKAIATRVNFWLDSLSVSHANWGILQTLASNAQTRHATGLANALLLLPSGAWCCQWLLADRRTLAAYP